MKQKILTTIAMTLSMTCLAEEMPTLKIKTGSAESSILLKDINRVNYTDTEMVINLFDGSSKTFVIDDIKSLAFDNMDPSTSIKTHDNKEQNNVSIFDISGIKRENTDKNSIYIIKSGKTTKKIRTRK